MVSAHGAKWSWSTLARYQMEGKGPIGAILAPDFDLFYLSVLIF